MTKKPCKGCGKEIVYADLVDEQGISLSSVIPLDPKPPVYQVNSDGTCERRRSAMVSHFATCPQANRFRGNQKRNTEGRHRPV